MAPGASGTCTVCGELHAIDFEILGVGLCPLHLHELLHDTFSEMGVELHYLEWGVSFVVPAVIEWRGETHEFPDWEFEIRNQYGHPGEARVDVCTECGAPQHPHCSDGYCCLGSNYELLVEAVEAFDWAKVVALATVAACTYSPGGQYRPLKVCECCGDEESVYTCDNCGRDVCDYCYTESTGLCGLCGTQCCECSKYVEHTDRCEECNDKICEDCAREVEICATCGQDLDSCECEADDQDPTTIILCGYHYRKRYPRPARQLVLGTGQVAGGASSGDQWVRVYPAGSNTSS